MFYQNTTKMPEILRSSSNTGELTVALYFKWTEGETIFTLTALPRGSKPCETIQLYHYKNLFYVNFQSHPYQSGVVIIVFLTTKVVKIIVLRYVVSCHFTYYIPKKKERIHSCIAVSSEWTSCFSPFIDYILLEKQSSRHVLVKSSFSE